MQVRHDRVRSENGNGLPLRVYVRRQRLRRSVRGAAVRSARHAAGTRPARLPGHGRSLQNAYINDTKFYFDIPKHFTECFAPFTLFDPSKL